jgi:hypothetical protein
MVKAQTSASGKLLRMARNAGVARTKSPMPAALRIRIR